MAYFIQMQEQGVLTMQNKYGNDVLIIDLCDICKQVQEANVRHLKAVRDRYRKYQTQGKVSGDSTLRAEQLCQLAQWKKQLGKY